MRRVVLKIYEDDDHCLDFLRNFLKDSMIVVQLFSCKRTNTWDFVSKLLEKSKKIKILEVDNSTLTEECLLVSLLFQWLQRWVFSIRTRQMAKCLAIYQIVLRTYRCTASEVGKTIWHLNLIFGIPSRHPHEKLPKSVKSVICFIEIILFQLKVWWILHRKFTPSTSINYPLPISINHADIC